MIKFSALKCMEPDTGANGGSEGIVDNNSNVTEEQEEVKTFTQEEVNEMIGKRLAKEKAKYTKEMEDFKASFGKEKFEEGMTEAEKLAKMTAQERAEYEFSKQREEFESERKAFEQSKLKDQAVVELGRLGYSEESVELLKGLIDYTNADTVKTSMDNINKVLQSVIGTEVDKQVNEKVKTNIKPENNPAKEMTEKEQKLKALRHAMGLK